MTKNQNQLITEESIKSHWKTRSPKPVISIICITYNHIQYIDQCLISLLSQQTRYSFEVIIHDDNSTDGTKEIIEQYKRRFPTIIKAIIQEENQYSKGIRILPFLAMPACTGELYAICEGDDYWISTDKLDRQADFMIHNKEVVLTCHAAQIVDAATNESITTHYPKEKAGFILPDEVILGDGNLIPTPSIMVRSCIRDNIPKWWEEAHISDYPLVLKAILLGKVYNFNESWCAYRIGVANSWNSLMQDTFTTKIYHADRMKKILTGFLTESKKKYSNSAKIMMSEYYFAALVRTKDSHDGKILKYKEIINYLIWPDKILIYLKLKINFRIGLIRKLIISLILRKYRVKRKN